MVCLPCQKKAEARRQATVERLREFNPAAAERYRANLNVKSKTLPRYEGKPIVSKNTMRPRAIWNETYRAFTINKNA